MSAAHERQRQQVLREGRAIDNYETDRVHKDGRRITVLTTLSPLRDDAGTVVGTFSIMKDITTHRHVEEQATALARLEERDRIARDLHDGALQSLYGIALKLGAPGVYRQIGQRAEMTRCARAERLGGAAGASRLRAGALIAVALVLVGIAGPVRGLLAQEPALIQQAAPPPAVDPEQLQELVTTLEDPAARARFVAQAAPHRRHSSNRAARYLARANQTPL